LVTPVRKSGKAKGERAMAKPRTLGLLLATLALGLFGCKQSVNDNDAIRGAINNHLAARGNLNTAAFETEIQKVNIQGDQAQADVVFHVKGGPGMMQLSYNLKKTNAAWAVVESNPVGSNFTHPSLDGTAPPTPASPESGSIPNILDSMHQRMGTAATGTGQNLPPGHPQVNTTYPPK
jgi:hypothetical protein